VSYDTCFPARLRRGRHICTPCGPFLGTIHRQLRPRSMRLLRWVTMTFCERIAANTSTKVYLEQLFNKIGVPIERYPRRGMLLTQDRPRAQQANPFAAFGERVPPRVTHFPKNPRALKRSFAMLGMIYHSQPSCVALSILHVQTSARMSSQSVVRPCAPPVVPVHPKCSNG
jgi:hypothetical protein